MNRNARNRQNQGNRRNNGGGFDLFKNIKNIFELIFTKFIYNPFIILCGFSYNFANSIPGKTLVVIEAYCAFYELFHTLNNNFIKHSLKSYAELLLGAISSFFLAFFDQFILFLVPKLPVPSPPRPRYPNFEPYPTIFERAIGISFKQFYKILIISATVISLLIHLNLFLGLTSMAIPTPFNQTWIQAFNNFSIFFYIFGIYYFYADKFVAIFPFVNLAIVVLFITLLILNKNLPLKVVQVSRLDVLHKFFNVLIYLPIFLFLTPGFTQLKRAYKSSANILAMFFGTIISLAVFYFLCWISLNYSDLSKIIPELIFKTELIPYFKDARYLEWFLNILTTVYCFVNFLGYYRCIGKFISGLWNDFWFYQQRYIFIPIIKFIAAFAVVATLFRNGLKEFMVNLLIYIFQQTYIIGIIFLIYLLLFTVINRKIARVIVGIVFIILFVIAFRFIINYIYNNWDNIIEYINNTFIDEEPTSIVPDYYKAERESYVIRSIKGIPKRQGIIKELLRKRIEEIKNKVQKNIQSTA